MDPHPISARREQQAYFPEKGKYVSLEIYLPAYGIILCAFNGTLAMGVRCSSEEKCSAESALCQCITDNKSLIKSHCEKSAFYPIKPCIASFKAGKN